MKRISFVLLLVFALVSFCQGKVFNIFSKAKIEVEGKKNFSYRKVDGNKKIITTESSSGNPANNSLNSYYIENKELEESAGLRVVVSLFSWLNFYGEGGKTENTRISSMDYYNYYYGNLNQESANPGLYGLAGGEITFFDKKKIKMKLGYERKETEYKKIITKTEYSSSNNWGGSKSTLERKSEEEKYLLKIALENGLYAGTGYSAYKSKYLFSSSNYYSYNYSGYSYNYNNETKEEADVSNKSKIDYFIGYSAALGESFLLDTKLSFGDNTGIEVGLRLIL